MTHELIQQALDYAQRGFPGGTGQKELIAALQTQLARPVPEPQLFSLNYLPERKFFMASTSRSTLSEKLQSCSGEFELVEWYRAAPPTKRQAVGF